MRIENIEIEKPTATEIDYDCFNNRLYYGDNLTVLKKLQVDPRIRQKVKLIYIDPPYATNQEFRISPNRAITISKENNGIIAYSDRLVGEEYLSFLKQRLVILRDILSDDGSIYVHIDCKMGHYVKIIMDEIFGSNMFINDMTRIKCSPKNFNRKGFGNVKDMILFYSKTSDYIWNEQRTYLNDEELIKLYPKKDKMGRRYTTTPLHAPGETSNGDTGRPWKNLLPPRGRHWRYNTDTLDQLDKANLIEWSSSNNPRLIIYADDAVIKGKKIQDIWEFKDPIYPIYPTEKNQEMLKLIISTSSNENDIVLDCFAGSGSTLVAAENLGRKWIGVDNSPIAIETMQKRLDKLSINYIPFYMEEI